MILELKKYLILKIFQNQFIKLFNKNNFGNIKQNIQYKIIYNLKKRYQKLIKKDIYKINKIEKNFFISFDSSIYKT